MNNGEKICKYSKLLVQKPVIVLFVVAIYIHSDNNKIIFKRKIHKF